MATYTYSGNPASSDADWIRFRVADVDVSGLAASADFSDEEIASVLAEHDGNKWRAAHSLLRQRLQKYLKLAQGAGSDELDQIVTSSRSAIAEFMAEAAAQGIVISLTSQTTSSKELMTSYGNVQPRFFRGMHDMSPDSAPFSTIDD